MYVCIYILIYKIIMRAGRRPIIIILTKAHNRQRKNLRGPEPSVRPPFRLLAPPCHPAHAMPSRAQHGHRIPKIRGRKGLADIGPILPG